MTVINNTLPPNDGNEYIMTENGWVLKQESKPIGKLQQATVAVERLLDCTVNIAAHHHAVGSAPLAQSLTQSVNLFIPHRLWVEHQAPRKSILAQNKAFLARCLQHLAENGRQENASLGIGLGLYVSYKSHVYFLI